MSKTISKTLTLRQVYPDYGVILADQTVTKDVVFNVIGHSLQDSSVAIINLQVTIDGMNNVYNVPFDYSNSDTIEDDFYSSLS